MPYPIDRRRSRWSRPSKLVFLHSMPAQSRSSVCDFRWYCCPQIYNRFLPAYPAFAPNNRLEPAAPDDTSYRSRGFPAEFRYRRYHHPAPAAPVLHKIPRKALRLSSVCRFRDSAAARVSPSYRCEDCTMLLAFLLLRGKFCKECFFRFLRSLFYPPISL